MHVFYRSRPNRCSDEFWRGGLESRDIAGHGITLRTRLVPNARQTTNLSAAVIWQRRDVNSHQRGTPLTLIGDETIRGRSRNHARELSGGALGGTSRVKRPACDTGPRYKKVTPHQTSRNFYAPHRLPLNTGIFAEKKPVEPFHQLA